MGAEGGEQEKVRKLKRERGREGGRERQSHFGSRFCLEPNEEHYGPWPEKQPRPPPELRPGWGDVIGFLCKGCKDPDES